MFPFNFKTLILKVNITNIMANETEKVFLGIERKAKCLLFFHGRMNDRMFWKWHWSVTCGLTGRDSDWYNYPQSKSASLLLDSVKSDTVLMKLSFRSVSVG